MSLYALEDALCDHLRKDPRVQIDAERILVMIRDGDVMKAEMADGGCLVQFQGSLPLSYLANGATLHHQPRMVVAVGGRRDENPSGVYELMEQVIKAVNGHEIGGFVFAFDGSGSRRVFDAVFWYDVAFRIQCTMEATS